MTIQNGPWAVRLCPRVNSEEDAEDRDHRTTAAPSQARSLLTMPREAVD
jgi:hypothetical protein